MSIRRALISSSVAVFFLIFFSGVWYVTRLPSLTVRDIHIEGLETLEESDVERVITKELSGSYFALIPKKFIYLYPQDAIHDALIGIGRVRDVSVTENNTALLIDVVEQKPHGLWCSDDADSEHDAHCFYTDATGRAYEEAPTLTGSTLKRFVVEGITPKKDMSVLQSDQFSRLQVLTNALEKKFELRVVRLLITKDGDMFLSLATGGDIRVGPTDAPDTILSNLGSILESDEFKDLKKKDFEYIDLRFGNKVFVEKQPPLDNSASSSEALPLTE